MPDRSWPIARGGAGFVTAAAVSPRCTFPTTARPPWMDVNVLDADNLLPTFAALAVQRRQQLDERAGRVRRGLAQALGGLKRLFVEHSPAAALHRCVMRRHRLGANHGLDLVGGRECLQAFDRDEELPVTIFIRLARGKPAGIYHRIDQRIVEPIAPRSADDAQSVGIGRVHSDHHPLVGGPVRLPCHVAIHSCGARDYSLIVEPVV